jgi:poly(3-hydroxybutyrate) depolymerase
MNRHSVSATLLSVLLAACGPEWQSPETTTVRAGLTQESGWGSNPGSLTLFTYVPANVTAHPALVVAMHGCTQSAAAYVSAGWNALADQYGFIVAYPQTTANNNCFNWFGCGSFATAGFVEISIT